MPVKVGGEKLSNVVVRRQVNRRPIDKDIQFVSGTITNSQTDTSLHNAPDSRTLVRIVGNLMVKSISGTDGSWSVLITKQQQNRTPNTMSLSSGSHYTPESDVLWHGSGTFRESNDLINFQVDVKGMRKMQAGDDIYISFLGSAATIAAINGSLSMFFKG